MLNIADYNLPPSPLFKNLRRLANDLGPDFFLRLLKDKIKEEAHIEASAMAEAMAESMAEAMTLAIQRKFLLRLLHKAGLAISNAQRARIERCDDADQIERWGERVLTAGSARDVFAAPKKRSLTAAKKPSARTSPAKPASARKPAKKQSAAPGRTRRS